MTATTILGLITLGVVLIAVLMAVFALVVPTKNKLANRLMAAYLIILSITISGFFYYQHFTPPLVLEKLRDDINLLSSPLFYLFVNSLLYQGFKLRWKDLWHALPFILTFLLFVPNFYSLTEAEREVFFDTYFDHWETHASMVIGHLQAILYIIAVFIVLNNYRKVFRENYADTSALTHKWLWQMNTLLAGLFVFSLFKNVFKRMVNDYDLVTFVRIGMVSLLFAFLCWMLFKIMLHPSLFRGVDAKLVPLSKRRKEGDTTEDSRVSKLKAHMTQQQPYLEPTLSVKDLASQLGWPERDLSVLINQELDRHFFDFVNDYRISEAQAMLRDPANSKMTVLEVLYAVGFNSKSSFNVAFKNRTGLTPSLYRKANN